MILVSNSFLYDIYQLGNNWFFTHILLSRRLFCRLENKLANLYILAKANVGQLIKIGTCCTEFI